MGNTNAHQDPNSITGIAELDELFVWCGGSNRKPEQDGAALPPAPEDDVSERKAQHPLPPQTPKTDRVRGIINGEDNVNTSLITPRSSQQRRKSTAELAEVGMSEGALKQRIMKLSTLDDALADKWVHLVGLEQ
jgi:hypothetical protein